jgi:hypothetical protein
MRRKKFYARAKVSAYKTKKTFFKNTLTADGTVRADMQR